MPYANSQVMQVFLDRFSGAVAEDEDAVMVLDRAGWHGSNSLAVPTNITLVPSPSFERIWLYLKECQSAPNR